MTNGIRTALVVDDEEALREIVSEVLSLINIECLIAEDGIQAIELAEQNKDSIDLFLIDMFMPNMSGEETFSKLSEMIPGCPVIFMSGYEKDSKVVANFPDVKFKFLKKPFGINDLKNIVASI